MKKKQNIDIAIVTNSSFPLGMASTNRIVSYSKFLARRKNIKVFITKPTERESNCLNSNYKGNYQGVYFEYVNGYTVWPYASNKLYKLLIILSGYYKLIIHLFHEKPSVVLLYSSSNNTILRVLILLFKFILKYKLIIEENEYPKVLQKKNNNIVEKWIILYLYRWSDGMLVMTKELSDFYSSIKVQNIFILPMTVDIDRFSKKQELTIDYKYFVYAGGSGGFKRDGVFEIIKGFTLFRKNNNNFKLLIIGPIDLSDGLFKKIQNYMDETNANDNIKFLGRQSTDEVVKYLQNAEGIVMAPPVDFPSGGFPTKLGEFLASGTPVICTKVSEITKYLSSNNAFLIEPQNINEIADSMRLIVINKHKAIEVGKNGMHTADKFFNANNYITELSNFLFSKNHG